MLRAKGKQFGSSCKFLGFHTTISLILADISQRLSDVNIMLLTLCVCPISTLGFWEIFELKLPQKR